MLDISTEVFAYAVVIWEVVVGAIVVVASDVASLLNDPALVVGETVLIWGVWGKSVVLASVVDGDAVGFVALVDVTTKVVG